jgi:hypothetical protein
MVVGIRTKLLDVIGKYLDSINAGSSSVDVPVCADRDITVYITPPAGYRDELDDVAIYDAIAAEPCFDDFDIEIEILDQDEREDALEGAYGTRELEDDEEEEDELEADKLSLVEDDDDPCYSDEDEDDDEDDDDIEYQDDEDIDGIDEYEPSWDDLAEIMRERDDY